jgi:hypothetical protein
MMWESFALGVGVTLVAEVIAFGVYFCRTYSGPN